MEDFRVRVSMLDPHDSIPVLICKRDADGELKAVRFRIEISRPLDLAPCATTLTMVMEKGAMSTFKAAYQYAKARWM